MTVDAKALVLVLAGCYFLGGFVPWFAAPWLGARQAARWSGWGAIAVLLVVIGLRVAR